MIIHIRGTSGSGKSTAMRAVMAEMGQWDPVIIPKRRQPYYYSLRADPSVCVLGHYETPCGGADNIGSAPDVYNATVGLLEAGKRVVLSESILMSLDAKWTIKLKQEYDPDVRVLILTTPLETCFERIHERRKTSRRASKPLNNERTTGRVPIIERCRIRLLEAGVMCRRLSDRQAPGVIVSWLREGLRGARKS